MGQIFPKSDCGHMNEFLEALDEQRIDKLETFLAGGLRVDTLETALLRACHKMLMQSIDFLLLHDAKVDVLDFNGHSPIYIAVSKGSIELVKKLLEHGAGVNFTGPGSKESPLHAAVSQNCEEIVALLLQFNANTNAHFWGIPSPLFGTLRTGNVTVAQMLLNHGADLNAHRNSWDGETVLCAALYDDTKLERLAALFVERGADIYNVDSTRNTALHRVESVTTTKMLLRHGANVNSLNKKKQTPLHTNPSRQVLKLLLEAGADVQAVDEGGNTALHAQASFGNLQVVEMLLQTAEGCTLLHAVNLNGQTPLHVAAASDSSGQIAVVVQTLMDHGASLEAVDKNGKTPHDVATKKGRVAAMLAIQAVKENADISFK